MSRNHLPLLPLLLESVPHGLRQALAQEGIPFRQRGRGRPEGRFVLDDCRVHPRPLLEPGQILIDVDELRQDLAGDPFEELLDQRSAAVQWEIGGLAVTETVARFDKREVRRLLLTRLRRKVEQAGGIWLRIAAFPYPYRSAFNFRIDYDDYHAADFEATLATVAGSEGATTHFVNVAGFRQAPDALARLRGLDVGSHGYWHHTYRTVEENIRNIFRGIEALQTAGIEPSGFAAPHGRFNRGLFDALTALGIPYGSEFGLAYDDRPFFVGTTGLLQIPVHPICLGVVMEAASRLSDPAEATRRAVRTTMDYWDQYAQACRLAGEPVFLYGHPTGRLGRYPEVLRHALQLASNIGSLWKTTFRELNSWWRARERASLSVRQEDGYLVVAAESLATPYRLAVEYVQGEQVAVMPLDGPPLRFSTAALTYENRRAEPAVRPVRVDPPQRLRGRIRRWIDWEWVTPIEEIPTDNWQNLAKRTLRQLLKKRAARLTTEGVL